MATIMTLMVNCQYARSVSPKKMVRTMIQMVSSQLDWAEKSKNASLLIHLTPTMVNFQFVVVVVLDHSQSQLVMTRTKASYQSEKVNKGHKS